MRSTLWRSRKRAVAGVLAGAVALSGAAFVQPALARQTVVSARVSGADRYATAAAVATATFPGGSNSIVLASGENFPDGLAAAGLAGAVNGPVLLTQAAALPISTLTAINSLDAAAGGPAATVYVVGGTAAIGTGVRDALRAGGYTLVEVGGADRYATAAAVAERIAALSGIGSFNGRRTAFLVTGENFPDALAAGSPAYFGDIPILLTQTATLTPATAAALTARGIQQVIILGGTAAVSAAVETAVSALTGITVTRVQGATRYATATALADLLVRTSAAGGFGYDITQTTATETDLDVVLVSGENFPDALAAGPHAGVVQAPILLTQTAALPADTATWLTANRAIVGLVRAIGGTAAVSDAALTAAVTAASQTAPTGTISASQGAATLTVVFSEDVTAATATNIANYRINNAPLTAGVATYNAATRTVTITGINQGTGPGGTLGVGDVITLTAGGILSPDNRAATATAVSVVADVTRPTVSSILAFQGANEFVVTFSEPMNAADLATVANYAITGAGAPAITGTVVSTDNRSVEVQLGGALAAGQTVTVAQAAANSLEDLAGNDLTGTLSQAVTIDAAAPTVTAASRMTVAQTAATATVNTVTVQALGSGAAAGAAGTGWQLTIVNGGSATPSVTVDTVGRSITATVLVATPNSAQLVAGALNNNADFNTRFTATAPAGVTAAGTAALAGGTSNVVVTVTFSEAVDPDTVVLGDFILDLDGNPATAGDQSNPVTATPNNSAAPTSYTLTFSAATGLPTASSRLIILAGTIADFAGNGIAGVSSFISTT